MNPQDHTGRTDSPFIDTAENAYVIDLTDTDTMPVVEVLPEPVSANRAVGVFPSVLPNRRGVDTWLGLGASALALAVLVVGGLAVGAFL